MILYYNQVSLLLIDSLDWNLPLCGDWNDLSNLGQLFER